MAPFLRHVLLVASLISPACAAQPEIDAPVPHHPQLRELSSSAKADGTSSTPVVVSSVPALLTAIDDTSIGTIELAASGSPYLLTAALTFPSGASKTLMAESGAEVVLDAQGTSSNSPRRVMEVSSGQTITLQGLTVQMGYTGCPGCHGPDSDVRGIAASFSGIARIALSKSLCRTQLRREHCCTCVCACTCAQGGCIRNMLGTITLQDCVVSEPHCALLMVSTPCTASHECATHNVSRIR